MNEQNNIEKRDVITEKTDVKIAYRIEGLRRMTIRKENRKQKWTEKVRRYGRGTQDCSMCRGQMSWCSSCEVWSSTCCCDYGTCQCS